MTRKALKKAMLQYCHLQEMTEEKQVVKTKYTQSWCGTALQCHGGV